MGALQTCLLNKWGMPQHGGACSGPREPAQEHGWLVPQRLPDSPSQALSWLPQAPSQEAQEGGSMPSYFHPGQAVLGSPPK